MLAALSLLAAAPAKPAGGAALGEVALVAGSLTVAFGGLGWMALRERRGERTPLGAAAARAARTAATTRGWRPTRPSVGDVSPRAASSAGTQRGAYTRPARRSSRSSSARSSSPRLSNTS